MESNSRLLGRRRFIKASAASALFAAVAGNLSSCASSSAHGAEEIQVWHLFTGGDGGVFSHLLDLVQEQDPTISINPVVLTWGGPYYTKIAMASVGGRAPDLAVMHATRLVGYAPGGLLDTWDVERLSQHGIDLDTIPKGLIERCTVDDKLYGIPLDFHAFILLYNKDICAQAGVLDEDEKLRLPDGNDGFLDLAQTLSDHLGAPAISYGFTADGAQMSRMFWALYAQQGAVCELTPGEPAKFDITAACNALEWVQTLFSKNLAAPSLDYGGSVASFSTGRSALNFNGNWEIPAFEAAGIPLGAHVMPTVFDQPGTFGDSHVFVLPHQDYVDEQKRDAAYRVVAGMLRNSLDWAKGGHIPASDSVTSSAQYLSMHPYCDYVQAKTQSVFEPRAWFTGSGSDFQARLGEVVQDAWLKGTDAEQTALAIQARLDNFLRMDPPV